MVMKLGIDRPVDDPSLEPGISVGKRYGCHRRRIVLRRHATVAVAEPGLQIRHSFQPQRLGAALQLD